MRFKRLLMELVPYWPRVLVASFIIAHRLSTVEFADKIIVLEEGCITQEGTHHQLACLPGLYRKLLQRTQ